MINPNHLFFWQRRQINEDHKLPRYFVRAIATARAFSEFNYQNKKYRGLLILLGDPKQIRRVTRNGRGTLIKELRDQYTDPALFSGQIFKIFDEMGLRDGAIAFDTKGNLIDAEIYIDRPAVNEIGTLLDDIIAAKGRLGARHISGAYACLKGINVVSVSEETGVVIPFYRKKLIRDLVYRPQDKNN